MVCSAFALSSQVFCCALLSHEITFHEGHSVFFAIYLASRCRSPVLKSQCAAILYRVRLLRREAYGKETVKTPETFAQSISFAQFSHQPSLIPAHVGYFLVMISMFFFISFNFFFLQKASWHQSKSCIGSRDCGWYLTITTWLLPIFTFYWTQSKFNSYKNLNSYM